MSLRRLASIWLGLLLLDAGAAAAGEFGTRDEARALLDRTVAAIEVERDKTLRSIRRGVDGYVDRDLYAFCAGLDGMMVAHPYFLDGPFKDFVDVTGKPVGREVYANAEAGVVKEIDYKFVRLGSGDEAFDKILFYTQVDDLICAVGYYLSAPSQSTALGTDGSTG